jgi:hypothetical protein
MWGSCLVSRPKPRRGSHRDAVTDEVRKLEKGQDMTQKDYWTIANIVKKHRDESATAKGEFAEMVESFCLELKAQNPRFKREIFERACGLDN